MVPGWMTTGEAARALRVRRETIRRWATAGFFLPGEVERVSDHPRSHRRISVDAVKRILRERRFLRSLGSDGDG